MLHPVRIDRRVAANLTRNPGWSAWRNGSRAWDTGEVYAKAAHGWPVAWWRTR